MRHSRSAGAAKPVSLQAAGRTARRDTQVPKRAVACALLLVCVGCYSSRRSNARFPQKLAVCASAADAQELLKQAQVDLSECTNKVTFSSTDLDQTLSCEDARSNVERAKKKLAILRRRELAPAQAPTSPQLEGHLAKVAVMLKEQEADDQRELKRRRDAEREAHLRTLEACSSNSLVRASRRRHKEVFESDEAELYVKRHCTPRTETISASAQCTDGNGFVRACTKKVAGEVIGYTCGKGLDQEMSQLGLLKLGLIREHPFPDELNVSPGDADCAAATRRLEQLGERAPEEVSP